MDGVTLDLAETIPYSLELGVLLDEDISLLKLEGHQFGFNNDEMKKRTNVSFIQPLLAFG